MKQKISKKEYEEVGKLVIAINFTKEQWETKRAASDSFFAGSKFSDLLLTTVRLKEKEGWSFERCVNSLNTLYNDII
jgi:hypothetical protein